MVLEILKWPTVHIGWLLINVIIFKTRITKLIMNLQMKMKMYIYYEKNKIDKLIKKIIVTFVWCIIYFLLKI